MNAMRNASPLPALRLAFTTSSFIWLGAAAATLAIVWPAFAHGLEVWSTTEEFSYGYLIPPISAAVIWFRRRAVRESLGRGATAGLLVVLPSLVVYLAAQRMSIHALAGVAVSPLLWGAAVYLWGWRTGRVLAFPLAFLVF